MLNPNLSLLLSLSLTISLLASLASPTPLPLASSSNQPTSSSLSPVLHPPLSPLRPRTIPANTVYAIPHTQTHLSIQVTTSVLPALLLPMLTDAYNSILAHLLTNGDGLLAAGTWSFAQANVGGMGYNVGVSVRNANNHQVTWGVLGSAVWGLGQFMRGRGHSGSAVFEVWDGLSQVGQGEVAVTWRG